MDSCEDAQASEVEAVYAEADSEGIDAEPSIRHETKIRAGSNYLDHVHSSNLKNHNMDEVPPKIQFPLGGKKELNQLITTGVVADGSLEDQMNQNETALDEESMNEGERLPGVKPTPVADIKIPNVHSVQHNPETGLPLFLKHPKNGQYLRPAQVPMRRYPSHVIERRPMMPHKRPMRPFVIPQPAPLMNHYKPQSQHLVGRPGPPPPPPPSGPREPQRENHPNHPNKPVLLLSQPTEIKPHVPSGQ